MPLYLKAFPYQDDVLTLPVLDVDVASAWYAKTFGLTEVERRTEPFPAVILEREGVRLGFSLTGEDPAQDGAAILVSDIERAKAEVEASGVEVGNCRIDEIKGQKLQVFFVVAPDGLCYYFHQPI